MKRTWFVDRKALITALVVMVFVMGIAVGGHAEPKFGGTVTVGTLSDPDTLNVLQSNSVQASWILNLLYPSLMVMNENGEKIGYLATDWGYSEDGLIAWFEIRDDIYWENGAPVTSEDVKFTADVTMEHSIGFNASLLASVTEIRTPTATRVEFHLAESYGPFLTSLGFWLRVVPKYVWENIEDPKQAPNTDAIGAGPFKLVEYEMGQYYRLEAVDSWFDAPGGRPYIDEVVFKVYPDMNTMVLALLRGDIDISAQPIPPGSLDRVKEAQGVKTATTPSLGYYYIGFNMQNDKAKALQDVVVRKAIAKATNKEMIRNMVLRGQGIDLAVAVSPVLGDWYNSEVTSYEFDLDEANQILEDAGYVDTNGDGVRETPNGEKLQFTLLYDGGHASIPRMMRIIEDDLRKIGIGITHEAPERNTYLSTFRSLDFDIVAGGWGIMDEPADYLALLYHSNTYGPNGINRGGVNNPELDELMDAAKAALVFEETQTYVFKIQEKLKELVPDVPLAVETFTFGFRDTLDGYGVYPSDLRGMVDPQSMVRVYKVQ